MSGAVAPGSGYARAGADELIPVGTPALREPQQEQQQPQPQMDLPPQQHPLLRHTESAPEHGAGSSAVNGSGGKGLGNYQTFGGYSAAEQQEYGGGRERQMSATITGSGSAAALSSVAAVDAEVDHNVEAMVFNLKQRFKQSGVTLPLEKQSQGGVYRLGSRKLQLSVRSNRLTVRVGQNYTDFLEFLSKAAF